MDIKDIFTNSVNPDTISVYMGRVISLDENFQDNGYLYVDLVDPNSKDLEQGKKTANKATASFALRNCHNSWEKPPEIKSKAQFMGAMNMTTSGDFHLRNYCFDMQTMTWFMTVSTALNAIGIVNIPPVMVSLDTTPFPGQAVSVNVAQAATEVVDEAIDNSLKDIAPEDDRSVGNNSVKPNKDNVLQKVPEKITQFLNPSRSNNRNSGTTVDDVIADTIAKIITPINDVLEAAFSPYYEFIECIKLLFEIYDSCLDDIEEITIPITQFTNIAEGTTNSNPNENTLMALKQDLHIKINNLKNAIPSSVIPSDFTAAITEVLYEPLAYMYNTVSDQIDDIVKPIKNKIVELISSYVKEPLSSLVGFISMAIQPAISALPTIVQIVVKMALKELLQVLLGKPIEFILSTALDAVAQLITTVSNQMKTKVLELFSDAIKVVITPIISVLQKAVLSLIPNFSIGRLKSNLEDIKAHRKEFPAIYIGVDPLKPYKQFIELNWSDPHEVSCMLQALLDESPLPDTYETPVGSVEIYKYVDDLIEWVENPLPYDPDNPPPYFVKEFTSKDEFMPIFLEKHPPVMVEAKLGEGMFADYGDGGEKEPSLWITNNVSYVTTDDGTNYIVALDDNTYVAVYYPESQEVGYVKLKKGYIYDTIETQHIIQPGEDDPTEGNDLIPVIEELNGKLVPKILKIQKTTSDTGELLYYDSTSETQSNTYNNLIKKYIQPRTKKDGEGHPISDPVYDPSKLFVYVQQIQEYDGEVGTETESNDTTSKDTLLSMLNNVIYAIGQNEGFSAGDLVDSVTRKVTSIFSPLSNSLDQVSNTISSGLEVVEGLQNIDNVLSNISEIGEKIEEISSTAKPALEATAKAAAAVALQSCSMTQSATGKDFSFTSGDNYDLSTTTDSRLQLPYCKELKREHFLEPNCKVLVLAVGAGKQNLYVVDILT